MLLERIFFFSTPKIWKNLIKSPPAIYLSSTLNFYFFVVYLRKKLAFHREISCFRQSWGSLKTAERAQEMIQRIDHDLDDTLDNATKAQAVRGIGMLWAWAAKTRCFFSAWEVLLIEIKVGFRNLWMMSWRSRLTCGWNGLQISCSSNGKDVMGISYHNITSILPNGGDC